MPYHVRGASSGAAAVTSSWTRVASLRSAGGIDAIASTTARASASALAAPLAVDLSSLARSFMAARSSALNPLDDELVASFLVGGFLPAVFLVAMPPSCHWSGG